MSKNKQGIKVLRTYNGGYCNEMVTDELQFLLLMNGVTGTHVVEVHL
ncbi:hypothetical protein [Niabella ginsenosidivorans]|nr:hypothetical protein [Niabella ginsenosidivorans]